MDSFKILNLTYLFFFPKVLQVYWDLLEQWSIIIIRLVMSYFESEYLVYRTCMVWLATAKVRLVIYHVTKFFLYPTLLILSLVSLSCLYCVFRPSVKLTIRMFKSLYTISPIFFLICLSRFSFVCFITVASRSAAKRK